jgi:hypothetical protein
MRGGARKGAGRKPTGQKGRLANFILSPETLALLATVPRGQRSAFVDTIIRQKLAKP